MSNQHYTAVIDDLRRRRGKLETEIREIDALIRSLERVASAPAGPALSTPPPSAVAELATKVPTNRRYSNISVRWAVLWYLTEFAEGDQKTAEIASALESGGNHSGASRFGNAVSAVLSTMKSKDEVEIGTDGGYRVSDVGRRNWTHIKLGKKFREAIEATLAESAAQEAQPQADPSRINSIGQKVGKS